MSAIKRIHNILNSWIHTNSNSTQFSFNLFGLCSMQVKGKKIYIWTGKGKEKSLWHAMRASCKDESVIFTFMCYNSCNLNCLFSVYTMILCIYSLLNILLWLMGRWWCHHNHLACHMLMYPSLYLINCYALYSNGN